MKKALLFFGFLAFGVLFRAPSVSAAEYPLSVSITPTALTASMTGVTGNGQYELVVLKAPFSAVGAINKQNQVPIDAKTAVQSATNGTVTWSVSGLNPSGTFYIRAYGLASGSIDWTAIASTTQLLVNGTTQTIASSRLNFRNNITLSGYTLSNTSGTTMVVQGKLDPTANKVFGSDMTAFNATLYISGSPFQKDDDSPETGRPFPAYANIIDQNGNVIVSSGPIQGIDSNGNYAFAVAPLSPNTNYYFKQVITAPGGIEKVERGGPFTTNGYTPTGSGSGSLTNLNDNVYHLLAPWPGLTQVLDPGTCAQQKASGKVSPNAICDVGDFLNLAFKTLIGLTAVALVLRLMYEGYLYMVSDVPILKTNAKSGFMTALIGLLVALSAYVILNTINPKLVSNSITIDQIDVSVLQLPDNADTLGLSQTEDVESNLTSGTSARSFVMNGTFSNPIPTNPQLATFVNNLKSKNGIINKVVVSVDAPNSQKNRITFYGSDGSVSPPIIVNIGTNGYSLPGQSNSGDKKTPIGTFTIPNDIRVAPDQDHGVLAHVTTTPDGSAYNFGAAFINTGAMVSGERAIGIHSNKQNVLKPTNGCIRMYNQDLVLVAPLIKQGAQVVIQKA